MNAAARTQAFDLEQFNDLLSGAQSWRLLYLPAEICPCRSAVNGAPQRDCPLCHGAGFTWQPPPEITVTERFWQGSQTRPPRLAHPVRTLLRVTDCSGNVYPEAQIDDTGRVRFPGSAPEEGEEFEVTYRAPQTVRGLITGLHTNREVGELGILEHQEANLTLGAITEGPEGTPIPNPAYEADENDRFVVVDARQRFQQVLIREEVDQPLLYSYIFGIRKVYGLSGGGYVGYMPSTDYILDGATLRWQPGQGPALGRPFAVIYDCAPEFYLFRSKGLNRYGGSENLPRRFSLRAWQLFVQPGLTRG